MKKKISLVLGLFLIFALFVVFLTACGKNSSNPTDDNGVSEFQNGGEYVDLPPATVTEIDGLSWEGVFPLRWWLSSVSHETYWSDLNVAAFRGRVCEDSPRFLKVDYGTTSFEEIDDVCYFGIYTLEVEEVLHGNLSVGDRISVCVSFIYQSGYLEDKKYAYEQLMKQTEGVFLVCSTEDSADSRFDARSYADYRLDFYMFDSPEEVSFCFLGMSTVFDSLEEGCNYLREEIGKYCSLLTPPEDFSIVFHWGIGEKNVYDTVNRKITKDLVCAGVETRDLSVSAEDEAKIYEKLLEHGILSIGEGGTSENLTTDGNPVGIKPKETYTVSVTVNGKSYLISGDETARYYPDNTTAVDFLNFVDFMKDFACQTPEYQAMPQSEGGYR